MLTLRRQWLQRGGNADREQRRTPLLSFLGRCHKEEELPYTPMGSGLYGMGCVVGQWVLNLRRESTNARESFDLGISVEPKSGRQIFASVGQMFRDSGLKFILVGWRGSFLAECTRRGGFQSPESGCIILPSPSPVSLRACAACMQFI